jgi:hypothetical protein
MLKSIELSTKQTPSWKRSYEAIGNQILKIDYAENKWISITLEEMCTNVDYETNKPTGKGSSKKTFITLKNEDLSKFREFMLTLY